jgi:hypothetical protein
VSGTVPASSPRFTRFHGGTVIVVLILIARATPLGGQVLYGSVVGNITDRLPLDGRGKR